MAGGRGNRVSVRPSIAVTIRVGALAASAVEVVAGRLLFFTGVNKVF